jgi:hypothetical protein
VYQTGECFNNNKNSSITEEENLARQSGRNECRRRWIGDRCMRAPSPSPSPPIRHLVGQQPAWMRIITVAQRWCPWLCNNSSASSPAPTTSLDAIKPCQQPASPPSRSFPPSHVAAPITGLTGEARWLSHHVLCYCTPPSRSFPPSPLMSSATVVLRSRLTGHWQVVKQLSDRAANLGKDQGSAVCPINGHLARPAQPGPSTTRPRHEAAQPDVARRTSCSCWAALWAEIIAQH